MFPYAKNFCMPETDKAKSGKDGHQHDYFFVCVCFLKLT